MTKQTKEKEQQRRAGPKFARNVLPDSVQIRRPASAMADLLDEADRLSSVGTPSEVKAARTPVGLTPVRATPVVSTGVVKEASAEALPGIDDFLDQVLPRFPPPRQAILLRLYRWCEGEAREMVV